MDRNGVAVIGLAGQSAFLSESRFPVPGETVSCSELFYELGGKGYNQAIACARMQVPTAFIGAMGNDMWADACFQELNTEGITTCLIPKQMPSAFAVITRIPDGENTVQVFPGAAKQLEPKDLHRPEVQKILQCSKWLLLQNELNTSVLVEACAIAKEFNLKVILNPAPAGDIPRCVLDTSILITPNYGEACALVGIAEAEKPDPMLLAEALRQQHLPDAVITLGGDGCMIVTSEEILKIPAFSYGKVTDTTGAGDTFNGVLTAMLSRNLSLELSARYAAVAAGIGVARPGAAGSIPYGNEIEQNIHCV